MKNKYQFRVLLIGLIFIFIAGTTFLLHARDSQSRCVLLVPVQQSHDLVDRLDRGTAEFASTTTDVMGRTTEGGFQITFTKNHIKQIVEQRFYGETGRSYMRFYYNENKLFALVKLDTHYEVPISVNSTVSIKDEEERDYYLDAHGQVCSWFLNDSELPVDKDTIDMIKEYISGIQ